MQTKNEYDLHDTGNVWVMLPLTSWAGSLFPGTSTASEEDNPIATVSKGTELCQPFIVRQYTCVHFVIMIL